jgi:hypothetical protein
VVEESADEEGGVVGPPAQIHTMDNLPLLNQKLLTSGHRFLQVREYLVLQLIRVQTGIRIALGLLLGRHLQKIIII